MTRTLLVAGAASHVGKSTIAAGLCRHLADRGISVAPFKAQNMSNNARVVARANADGSGDAGTEVTRWGEIGISQFVQSRAAGITPTTDCNPVLLKPRGSGESQLVVQGLAVGHFAAGDYYENHWNAARAAAEGSFRRLAETHEVIVAEGAGSIAEINLHDRDLANVETVRFAAEVAREQRVDDGDGPGRVDILLLVDIERGGAFASLYGTLELLPDDLRERVAGAVITKFRGDESLLEPGITEIESRTGVPVLGVVPYDDPGLPEEDSVGLPAADEYGIRGDGDGVPDERAVTVAVPRLPRISNATDLEALAARPGVRVAYVPLEAEMPLDRADAVVIPGTKNTVDDLLALRSAGFDEALERFSGPIVGLCGGYQLLGERLEKADREGIGERTVVNGLGLLPVETTFAREKHLERTTVSVDGNESALLAGASGTASGYEIHAGRTRALEEVGRPLGASSAARGRVLGTYLHGAFDNRNVLEPFLDAVYRHADRRRPKTGSRAADSPYDRAADLVRTHVDLTVLGPPFGSGETVE